MATLDGAPWFVAADVCKALGYSVSAAGVRGVLNGLDSDERKTVDGRSMGLYDGTLGGNPHRTILNEAGLYKLILRANKTRPAAAFFQRWVTREVLPAIRKTGGYVLAGADPAAVEVGATEMMPLPATFTEALRQHAATLIRLAEEKEAHAKTQAEKQAAEAAKAKAQAEADRLKPMAAAERERGR
ncbi:BRO-N domain-containing protein [Rhodoplanes serenus]|uniref:BRO-N domain-containing protein n=1 Tax=Rhodoplanes serenus TaxID=200615 RepID=UPI000DBC28E2|nr:BRO family protein [Rhodoplanes serenus]RAI37112.1 hypothetical protein CH340_00980 [Rhodoplanes serenus]